MTPNDRACLRAWLEREFGLDADTLGPDAPDLALAARRAATGLDGDADYLRLWRRDPLERQAWLEQLLVGETWFFRERGAFGLLRQHAGASGRADRPLRVLCLPCASGEEAWSIAITLRQAGLDADNARVVAMDASHAALDAARRGHYGLRALRGLDLRQWAKYLLPAAEGRFRVADSLRGIVDFVAGNALNAAMLRQYAPFDLIFCRNMMIYMSVAGRVQLCRSLADCLAADGLLFLGHAETPPEPAAWVRHGDSGAFAWRKATVQPRSPDAARRNPGQPPVDPPPGFCSTPAGLSDTSPAPRIAPPNPAPSPLHTARSLANQGAYQDALRLLEQAVAQSPLDPDIHALLGILHDQQNQPERAALHFRRALYLAPGHTESLAHLALLQERRGQRAEAERLRQRLRQVVGS